MVNIVNRAGMVDIDSGHGRHGGEGRHCSDSGHSGHEGHSGFIGHGTFSALSLGYSWIRMFTSPLLE